jgi:hypothetical protein
MDLRGIIAIGGKSGLFKVAAQGRNNIIVQSLDSGKKFPAFSSDRVSSLDEISIYTHDKDVKLTDVYDKLAASTDFAKSLAHTEPIDKLRSTLKGVLPNYNEEKVYDQDVRKFFQWFNILVDKGFISKDNKAAEELKESGDKLEASVKAKSNTVNKLAAGQTQSLITGNVNSSGSSSAKKGSTETKQKTTGGI